MHESEYPSCWLSFLLHTPDLSEIHLPGKAASRNRKCSKYLMFVSTTPSTWQSKVTPFDGDFLPLQTLNREYNYFICIFNIKDASKAPRSWTGIRTHELCLDLASAILLVLRTHPNLFLIKSIAVAHQEKAPILLWAAVYLGKIFKMGFKEKN